MEATLGRDVVERGCVEWPRQPFQKVVSRKETEVSLLAFSTGSAASTFFFSPLYFPPSPLYFLDLQWNLWVNVGS
jgi:hypothetical protein